MVDRLHQQMPGKNEPPPQSAASSNSLFLVLTMVAVLAAVATWMFQRSRDDAVNMAPAPIAAESKEGTAKTGKATPSAPGGAAPATPTKPTTTATTKAAPAPQTNAKSSKPTAKPAGSVEVTAVDVPSESGVVEPAPTPSAPPPADDAPGEAREHAPPTDALSDMTIYGPETPEVQPPVGVYIRWPTVPTEQQVGAIQVVISQSGTVEFTRPLPNPKTLSQYIVVTQGLSAAKTWRFRPALKNGRPVKYRLIVRPTDYGVIP